MTTLALAKAFIGHPGTIDLNGLSIHVRISDVKQAYGNVRYLVTPLSGTGSVWVDSSRVQFQKETTVKIYSVPNFNSLKETANAKL